MKAKITVKSIPDFEPQEKPYEVTDNGLVLRVQPSGAATFYAVYRIDGKSRRFRIGSAGRFVLNGTGKHTWKADLHPEVARTVLKEKLGEAARGVDPQAERQKKRQAEKSAKFQTVGGFLDHHYAPFLVTERKSGKATEARIRSCFGWLLQKPMRDITPFLLQSWRKKQLEGGKAPSSVNRDLTALKALLSKAVELGFIDHHPLAKLKPAKGADNARVRYLSPDEERRLFAAIDAREAEGREARKRFNLWRKQRHLPTFPEIQKDQFIDHLTPIVLLALNTGLRRGEIFNLEWRDIDFLHHRLTVRAASAKGAKTRHIPLNRTALDVLKRWRKQTTGDGLIFPSEKGERLDNISTSWGNLVAAADLEDFTFHDLRHDFATRTLRAGADIVTVSKLLGHSDLKMTMRYAHVNDETLTSAVERLRIND